MKLFQALFFAASIFFSNQLSASPRVLEVDWIVPKDQFDPSKIERKFNHQLAWRFAFSARRILQTHEEVIAEDGRKLTPAKTLFYATRDNENAYCSLTKSDTKKFVSGDRQVCLFDRDKDGEFENFAIGKYSRFLNHKILLEEREGSVKARLFAANESKGTYTLDGLMFFTSRTGRRLSLELFIEGNSLKSDCDFDEKASTDDDSVSFECGIPGLIITVRNSSLPRKAHRLEITPPKDSISIKFNGLKGVSFF